MNTGKGKEHRKQLIDKDQFSTSSPSYPPGWAVGSFRELGKQHGPQIV